MKPKDLKPQNFREKKEILIEDCVFFVPSNTEQEFLFPGFDDPAVFGNNHPVYVEYCSGNGSWIAEQALRHPEINFVAVEMKFKRVRKIWSKLKNHNLDNLFVVYGEAFTVTKRFFPKESISNIFINFPDPWPKRRHAKNRLLKDSFIQEMMAVMKKDAVLTFVTDDPDYSEEVIQVMKPFLTSLYDDPYYVTHFEGYGTSFFEELWREKGKVIRYHKWKQPLD